MLNATCCTRYVWLEYSSYSSSPKHIVAIVEEYLSLEATYHILFSSGVVPPHELHWVFYEFALFESLGIINESIMIVEESRVLVRFVRKTDVRCGRNAFYSMKSEVGDLAE